MSYPEQAIRLASDLHPEEDRPLHIMYAPNGSSASWCSEQDSPHSGYPDEPHDATHCPYVNHSEHMRDWLLATRDEILGITTRPTTHSLWRNR